MSSFACLRIELPHNWAEAHEPIRGSVQKVTEAYLETRWLWPRRFTPLTDLAFVLVDPRVAELEIAELRRLADELQNHLFGSGGEGEVSLLLFEGSTDSVIAFGKMKHEEIAALLAAPGKLPLGGRLLRIRPGEHTPVEHLNAPSPKDGPRVAAAASQAVAQPAPPPTLARSPLVAGLLGTYLLSRQVFVADMLAVSTIGQAGYACVVEDEYLMPQDDLAFDEACFRGISQVLAQKAGGLPLGVPVSFSHITRPDHAARFAAMLALLPKARRGELNASLYRLPRQLANGVAPLRPLLDPHFCSLNLITTDPRFEVEQLAARSVNCVVFCLREHDATARHAAMRAFAGRREAYQRRGVRQVLANVRTRAELEWAAQLDLQIVSGPAVSGFLDAPVGGRALPLPKLPLTAA
ncbi:hypothetical protein LJR225_000160 [Phenylobacterium sp. LjRoot225]|uniref:hypothetical protein n=1 Tax=Phenylobacterium sp. LjRoot225 TaxID=3342285 RepID=UPI003ECDD13E